MVDLWISPVSRKLLHNMKEIQTKTKDLMAGIANRVLFSKPYAVLYAIMLVLNVVLFGVIIRCYNEHGDVRAALHHDTGQRVCIKAHVTRSSRCR
jgi:hypothetical protein